MKYVQYKVVKRTTAEDVRHYMGLINSYEKEIEKCKNTINQNEELIEWARQQINIL
jgi:flagellar biosynthesis chaperone FliJ